MGVGVIERVEDHPFFSDWTNYNLSSLCSKSEDLFYEKGDIVVDIGGVKYGCYFILDGEVSVMGKLQGALVEVDRRGPGDMFGEVAMITHEPFLARVVTCTPCRIAFISLESVNEFLGPIPAPLVKLMRSVVRSLYRNTAGFAEKSVHQEKLAIVGSVVNDVVNNFQSPARMIELGTEAISRITKDRQIQRICSSITDQVVTIMSLSSELSSFVGSESKLKFTHVNLKEFVDEFCEKNHKFFKDNDFKITVDVPDLNMDLEPVSMMKAFDKILNNASFSSGEHRGQVSISAELSRENKVSIVFSDNGNGVSEFVRKSSWEPFATTEMGLGMAVIKGIVESHGGMIDFEPKDGDGTNFIIVLPRFHVTAT